MWLAKQHKISHMFWRICQNYICLSTTTMEPGGGANKNWAFAVNISLYILTDIANF